VITNPQRGESQVKELISRFGSGGWALLSLAFIVGLVGCTGGSGKGRPVKPVTVIVVYKSNPVDDATVTFICEEGEPVAAFGKTDASGVAKLQTPTIGNGAVLGKHKVVINKEKIINEKPVASQDSPEYAPLPPGGAPVPQVKDLIPSKYKAPGTTPLTAEVTSSSPNEFKFELTD
jgi:hypothetical protein